MNGFIFALNLDGQGGCSPLPSDKLEQEMSQETMTWVHLDYSVDGMNDWLKKSAGLDAIAIEALTAEETRPRCSPHRDGLILVLRGVNGNPGQDREDMVSCRLWVDKYKIISMRQRRLRAPALVKESLDEGLGPRSPAELLVAISHRMNDFIAEVVQDLDGQMDALEESVIESRSSMLRKQLTAIRRETVVVRRYLAPQRDALNTLVNLRLSWFDEISQMRTREVADRTMRFIEELESIRERAVVIHEDLTNSIAERMNRIMYFFSLVTGIFLPLGLLTGLLGINVGGIPGAENPNAFWQVCGLLLVMVVFQLALFRKMKWL